MLLVSPHIRTTIFIRINAVALIQFFVPQLGCLIEGSGDLKI